MTPLDKIARLSEDGHSLHIGSGGAEWIIQKEFSGWTTRHAKNGGRREATGAEMIAATTIVELLDRLNATSPPKGPQT